MVEAKIKVVGSKWFLQGGATLQLSWNTNPNSWALTLFFQVKCTMFWLKRGFKVHLVLYVPDFSKSTSEYLVFTKEVRKHGSRCFTAMFNFWMQCFKKNILSCLIIQTFSNSYYECIFVQVFEFFLATIGFHDLGGIFLHIHIQNRLFWTKK